METAFEDILAQSFDAVDLEDSSDEEEDSDDDEEELCFYVREEPAVSCR